MAKKHFSPKRWAHSLLSKFMIWLADLFSDIKVTGLENIPRKGGALLICNHLSYFDAVALAAALDKTKRDTMVLAKAELFESQVLGTVLRSVGTIPVYRGTNRAADSLKEAANSLTHGEIVAMFPEGTIPQDGRLMKFKTGASRLALETRVPVIPIGMVGTDKIIAANLKKVKRTLWKNVWRLPSIHIVIGEPIYLVGDPENNTDVQEATKTLRDSVEELVETLIPKQHNAAKVDKKGAAALGAVLTIPVVGLLLKTFYRVFKK